MEQNIGAVGAAPNKMIKSRYNIWNCASNGAASFGMKFHHFIVAGTVARIVCSTELK